MALPYFFASFADDPPPRGDGVRPQRPALVPVDAGAFGAEAERVRRIRAGDEEAYGALFAELYERLQEFCATYVGTVAIAEEIVQDVFLDLWVRRAEWNPQGGVRAYLFRAVRNRAINVVRDRRTAGRLNPVDVDAWMGTPAPPPDTESPSAALAAALAPVLETLPPARRRAALLRWRFGLAYVEIASILGTSVASVTMHIQRARETVRPVVEGYLRGE